MVRQALPGSVHVEEFTARSKSDLLQNELIIAVCVRRQLS